MIKCSDCPSDFEPKDSGTMTDIDGKKREFNIGNQVCLLQTEKSDKFFVLQELTFKDNGEKILRMGYYIRIKKEGKRKGKWGWGQFCPFIPRNDLVELIKKAKKEGML